MPGTPINVDQSKLNKLQDEQPKEEEVQQHNENLPVRELSQTDVLNKRLLVSFLKNINESDEGRRNSIDNKESDIADDNNADNADSDFLES